jgi:hypothetical protein
MESIMLLVIATFIASAIAVESFGSISRAIGAINGTPSLGYSTHVRLATIGRIFIIMSAPLIGYVVDSTNDPKLIIKIGVLCYTICLVFHCVILFSKFVFYKIPPKLFKLLNKGDTIKFKPIEVSLNFTFNILEPKVFYATIFSLSIQSIGVFLVNMLATIYFDYKATIVQTAGIITMFGTALHIFIVDPYLAKVCDKNKNAIETIKGFIFARSLAVLINLIILLIIYAYYSY